MKGSMTCKNCKNHFNYSSDDGLCNACYKLKLEGKLVVPEKASNEVFCFRCNKLLGKGNKTGLCKPCFFASEREKKEKKEKKENVDFPISNEIGDISDMEENDMGLFNFKKKEELKVKVLTCSRCGVMHQYTSKDDAAELLGFQRSHKCADLVVKDVPPPPAPDPTPTPMPSPSPVVDEDAPEYLDSEQGLPVEDDDGHEDRLYYLQQKLATLDEIFLELKNNGRKKGSM